MRLKDLIHSPTYRAQRTAIFGCPMAADAELERVELAIAAGRLPEPVTRTQTTSGMRSISS